VKKIFNNNTLKIPTSIKKEIMAFFLYYYYTINNIYSYNQFRWIFNWRKYN